MESLEKAVFLDELQKIAASVHRYTMSNSRSGKRPMRVGTLLKKEKEGTLFKDTSHFEHRNDASVLSQSEMVDKTDATTSNAPALEEKAAEAFCDELKKIAFPLGLELSTQPEELLPLLKQAGVGQLLGAGMKSMGAGMANMGARAVGGMRQMGSQAMSGMRQVGQGVMGAAQRGFSSAGQIARNAVSSVGGMARNVGQQVGNAAQSAGRAINTNVIKPMGQGFQHAYHQGSHGMLGNALAKPFGNAGRVAGGVIRAGINPVGTAAEGLVSHHGKNLAAARGWAPGSLKHNLATKVAPVAAEILGGAGVGTALHTPVSMAGALGHKALAGVGHLAPAIEHGLHAAGDFGHHLVSDVVGGKLQGAMGRIGNLARRFTGGSQVAHAAPGMSIPPPGMH